MHYIVQRRGQYHRETLKDWTHLRCIAEKGANQLDRKKSNEEVLQIGQEEKLIKDNKETK